MAHVPQGQRGNLPVPVPQGLFPERMTGWNPENHDSQGQRRFALYTSWGEPWES